MKAGRQTNSCSLADLLEEMTRSSRRRRDDADVIAELVPADWLGRSVDRFSEPELLGLIDAVFNRGDVDLGRRLIPALNRCFALAVRRKLIASKPIHDNVIGRFLSKGLKSTLAYVDGRFDRRYNVETSEVEFLPRLSIAGANAARGQMYRPSPVIAFNKALALLPADPGEFAFVDYGAGKGRTLILAAAAGFQHVVGVEFARELHESALRNVRNFRAKTNITTRIELLCVDATTYRVPDTPCVLYFYNPFDAEVLGAVLDNIQESYELRPRKMYLIYYRPQQREALDRADFLQQMVPTDRSLWSFCPTPCSLCFYETRP